MLARSLFSGSFPSGSLLSGALLTASLLATAACGDDSSGSGGGDGSTSAQGGTTASTSGGTGGGGTGGDATTTSATTASGQGATCTATFRVLQKDAYKETAGRSSPLWPPHTTTVLELSCDGAVVDSAFQANHGTEPGQVDAAGDVILEEMATFDVDGPEEDLRALLAAYEGCDCEDVTEFLSLDSLDAELAQGLLETVAGYLQTTLVCPDDGLEQLLGALEAGDFETALAILPTCTFQEGTDLEAVMLAAFEDLLAEAGETLDGYHVCNNDAVVQKALFDDFVASGATTCPADDRCRGPLFFYDP